MTLIQCLKFSVCCIAFYFSYLVNAEDYSSYRQIVANHLSTETDLVSLSLSLLESDDRIQNIEVADLLDPKVKCLLGTGKCSIAYRIKVKYGFQTRVVWFDVKVFKSVPVLQNDVEAGEELNLNQVKFEHRFIAFDQWAKSHELLNREFKVELAEGEVVQKSHLKQIYRIQAGDQLNVRLEVEDIELTFDAISLDKGNKGDEVRVKWKGSKEPILVRLTGEKEAHVI